MRKRSVHLLLLLFVLTACRFDSNESFIQGAWEIARTDKANQFFQWRFNNGAFTREQQIDQSTFLYTTGHYRVLDSEDQIITLELYDFEGDRVSYENNPMPVRVEIDPENEVIKITNVLFVRVGP